MADASDTDDILDGLTGEARAERAELVQWLLDQGIAADQIEHSVAPILLGTRRLIGDDGSYLSTREIAGETGLDLELVRRMQRAIGLPTVEDPDAAVYLRADAEAIAHTASFLQLGVDPDELLVVTRTLAEGLSNAAEAMRYTALATVLRPGATELEIAKASAALAEAALPELWPMVEGLLQVQLRQTFETEAISATERASGTSLPGARQIAVAFADLVGFTRLGEETPPEDLERLANRLGDMARDVADPPVRMVKTIGDAVMMVCPDPATLLGAMLQLAEAAESDSDFPRLRVGMAYGEAVTRSGDWFGSPVNLASRVTGVARPSSVLVSEAARLAVGDAAGFEWSYAGARHLKGIKGDTKLFRVRRAETGAGTD